MESFSALNDSKGDYTASFGKGEALEKLLPLNLIGWVFWEEPSGDFLGLMISLSYVIRGPPFIITYCGVLYWPFIYSSDATLLCLY